MNPVVVDFNLLQLSYSFQENFVPKEPLVGRQQALDKCSETKRGPNLFVRSPFEAHEVLQVD